jgi:hypothetical protein
MPAGKDIASSMPSASPSPTPLPMNVVGVAGRSWPPFGPQYPRASPLGVLTVALAYFALGVAVGALLKQRPRGLRWLPFLGDPGAVAALAYVGWVVRSLR